MHRVSEYKRTLASFPLLISSGAGSLSYLTVVNREEPTQEVLPFLRSFQRCVSLSSNISALTELAHTVRCNTLPLWALPAAFLPTACREEAPAQATKASSPLFGAATTPAPCVPRVWLPWGCSGCALWASHGSILTPQPFSLFKQHACNVKPPKLRALAPEEPRGHEEAPFSKSHPILQARDAVSKEMLWFLFWLFAQLGLHRAGFRDLVHKQRSTMRNIWKLWLLSPSEIWQFHFVEFLQAHLHT